MLKLILNLLLSLLSFLYFATPCFAEDFLICNDSANIYRYTDKSYESELKLLLYQLAGDDLIAFAGQIPTISIVHSEDPNASMLNGNLKVTSAMIDFTVNSTEIAFVLGHELGHLLKHNKTTSNFASSTSSSEEIVADNLSKTLLLKAGFKFTSNFTLLQRLAAHYATTHAQVTTNLENRSRVILSNS